MRLQCRYAENCNTVGNIGFEIIRGVSKGRYNKQHERAACYCRLFKMILYRLSIKDKACLDNSVTFAQSPLSIASFGIIHEPPTVATQLSAI